jgi:transcriptional regulator with XRE-family HTH domain
MRGDRLKILRIENRYSRKQLALALGVGEAGVARWEAGTQVPRADTVIKLCKLFNVSADYLLGLSDSKT